MHHARQADVVDEAATSGKQALGAIARDLGADGCFEIGAHAETSMTASTIA